jgi:hypothetical protein
MNKQSPGTKRAEMTRETLNILQVGAIRTEETCSLI